MVAVCLPALLTLLLVVGVSGCKSDATGDAAAAGVVVPCPGTSGPIPAGLPCGLVCRAALPVRGSFSRLFLVDVQVNGKSALMMLDTGADRTALSPLAAARLGLPPATLEAESIVTIGGLTRAESTTMQSIAFGNVQVGPGRVYLLSRTQGAAGTGELGFDGLLGDDILSRYQLDLDFQHQTVRLYEGKLCPGPLPGWSAEASVVPFTTKPGSNRVGVTALLNGMPVRTMLDTGLEATIAGAAVAQRLNVSPSELAHDDQMAVLGIGPGGADARVHHFQTLKLGAATILDPVVGVIPDKSENPWMILGDTVLATRRVWIDYAGRQVHFSQPD